MEAGRGIQEQRPDMTIDLMKTASLNVSENLQEAVEEREVLEEAAEDSVLKVVYLSETVGDHEVRKKELFSWSMALILIKWTAIASSTYSAFTEMFLR